MKGGQSGGGKPIIISLFFTVLISQSLVKCRSLEKELGDQKTYYSPDPGHVVSPPSHSHHHSRHSHRTPACPPPPHGASDCSCVTPPPHGGGGYYNSPPPSPTVDPFTPTPPLVPVSPPSPIYIPPTPTTPSTPATPSPPYIPVDPNSPPFTPGGTPGTCIYWGSNPTLIWGVFGYWATIGGLFGTATAMPFGSSLSVREALTNSRTDGFGALYREGTASYLNSLVNNKFPFTTPEVTHAFTSSLVSEKAAARQARVFRLANEGHLKKQY